MRLARWSSIAALAAMAGCIAPGAQRSEPPVDPDATPEVSDREIAIVQAVDATPAACERLISRLEETYPLLDRLDATIGGQAARLEATLEKLERPVVVPQAMECPPINDGELGNKAVIGAIEWLYMDPPGQHYRARVDSGAETSSLSASEVVEFERDSDDWVRFDFRHDPEDDPINFELPIKRTVLIRQAPFAEPERRVVIELDIRLGQELQTTEFTLTDRSRMTYPILLGRAFLMDLYIVDVSQSYTHDRYEAP